MSKNDDDVIFIGSDEKNLKHFLHYNSIFHDTSLHFNVQYETYYYYLLFKTGSKTLLTSTSLVRVYNTTF